MSRTARLARRILMAIGVVAAPLACGASFPANALEVGPKSLPLTVAGVSVEIPVAGSLDVRSDAAAIALQASAVGDLGSIQDHALAIARGLRLPSDACAHKGLNDVVTLAADASLAEPRRPARWGRQKRLFPYWEQAISSDASDRSERPRRLLARTPGDEGLARALV
jgi:hypothetical protein